MSIHERIRELCESLRDTAEQVDQSFKPPAAQLAALAETGYFTFVSAAGPPDRRRLLDQISAGCGATAFLASQHEAVCRMLHKAEHPLLENAQSGKIWMGVCFAHLRRLPSPVTVEIDESHLVFHGVGPWFSGVGLMSHAVIAGSSPEGQFLMAHCRLDAPGITVGESPRLAVMNATATSPLTFDRVRIPHHEIVVRTDAAEMSQVDMHSTVLQSGRSLGVARAAARFLPPSACEQLLARIEKQHARMDAWDNEPSWPTATELRGEAIHLAGLAVQSALVCSGGGAHLADHPVQRLAREASFYTTTQLTRELRDSYLSRLKSFA